MTVSSLVQYSLRLFTVRVPARHRNKETKLSSKQLSSWDLLDDFRVVLNKVDPQPVRVRPKGGPERLLHEEDYLCAFLFAQFNPVIDSARGLCASSHLPKVQQQVCSRPISLGAFSEAQAAFGSARIEKVFEHVVSDNLQLMAKGKPDGKGSHHLAKRLMLVDSTVFRAVARMQWAQWRTQGKSQSALRLHLKFNLFDEQPAQAQVTAARVCERKAFADMVSPGEFYVGDRYYGRDYKLLGALDAAGSGYIIRLCENANTTVIEELEIDDEDRAAGVTSDRIVRLGARECWHHGPVRVTTIEKPELDEPVIVVSNQLDRESFSAALIAEIYWQRWKIELFFRWLKCVLGRPGQCHWFAESPQGVAIQVYVSLIAGLLLSRRLGKLPNKRCMEMLRWHSLGMADDDDLEAYLERELIKKQS